MARRTPLVRDVHARIRKGKFTTRTVDPETIGKCTCGKRGNVVVIEGTVTWRCNRHFPKAKVRHTDSLQETVLRKEFPNLFGAAAKGRLA